MRKTTFLLICLLLLGCLGLTACQQQMEEAKIQHIEDLNGKRAGAMTGTPQDTIISSQVKNPQFLYFNSMPDMILALKENKIDFFVNNQVSFMLMQEENPEIDMLDDSIKSFDVGTIFSKSEKGRALKKDYDAYIKEIKEDGTLKELEEYWISTGEKKAVEIPKSGKNGIISMATSATMVPFSYYIDDAYAGFDIAIVAEYCNRRGYGLEISNMDFAGTLASVQSEKYDLGAGQISYTEERGESVLYSEFYFKQYLHPIIRKADGQPTKVSTIEGLMKSFQKTFLRENRWKMIARGLANTMLLTLLAAAIGSVLGFFIYMMASSGIKAMEVFSDIYIRIMQGTPMVVLLMIMYYVIFSKSNLSAFVVAVITFALNFAAYASEIIRSGVKSIPQGQWEAASALGFTKKQTFYHFIFPQVIQRIIPVYKSQIISLLKGTSIVGYIAIEDLTKVGDIIRSRTYEAFFPLMATAIFYFIMAWILTLIIDRIDLAVDPKKKRNHMRGEK